MREIKFRTWDDGVMLYSDAYDNEMNYSEWDYLRFFFQNIRTDAIVMQYTGLRDKNGKGKEIYEADIFNNTNKTAIGVVSWFEDKWVIKFPTYQYSLYQFLENDERRKVIGNIHDNPELLS